MPVPVLFRRSDWRTTAPTKEAKVLPKTLDALKQSLEHVFPEIAVSHSLTHLKYPDTGAPDNYALNLQIRIVSGGKKTNAEVATANKCFDLEHVPFSNADFWNNGFEQDGPVEFVVTQANREFVPLTTFGGPDDKAIGIFTEEAFGTLCTAIGNALDCLHIPHPDSVKKLAEFPQGVGQAAG